MKKLVLSLAVSLDGFIEGPNGEYDWCVIDPEYNFGEFFSRFDTIFVGRKTYEMTANMEGGPEGFPKFKEYVFSKTLTKVKDGTTLISSNIESEIEQIKNEKGKDIWLFGGAGLATSLMNSRLIDELVLSVCPVVLGGGRPLFHDISQRINLKLIDTNTYSSGLVSLSYSLEKELR